MRLNLHRIIHNLLLVLLALGGTVAPAQAQGWLEDRGRAEGPGIRLGDLELHPGIGAEIGYDSNVFYSDQDPTRSAILRVTPHLLLSTLGDERRGDGDSRGSPPAIAFRGGLSGSYYAFFTDRARDNMEADADLQLTINPERPFTLELTEQLGRSIRPFTQLGAADRDYGRIHNNAGAEISFGTEGGVLRGGLGYNLLVDLFEGDTFDYANNLTHQLSARSYWRFLPQTAILYDFRASLTNYNNTDDDPATLVSNNIRLRSRIGINGAVTNKLSVLAMVGMAAGFYDEAALDEFESIAAQLELRWQISHTMKLALGYDGDYANSFVGGFHRRDRGYLDFQMLVGGSFMLGGKASAGLYSFGAQLGPDGSPLGVGGTTDRSDIRVVTSLFGEYRLTDWLALNSTVSYTGDFTDFEYELIDPSAGPRAEPAGYNKFEAWFGVRAFY